MLTVKVICSKCTHLVTVEKISHQTYFQENFQKFLADSDGVEFKYLNYNDEGTLPKAGEKACFIHLALNDDAESEDLIVFGPAWVYIMNDSGKTVDQTSVNPIVSK
jgi:hypothetical protein